MSKLDLCSEPHFLSSLFPPFLCGCWDTSSGCSWIYSKKQNKVIEKILVSYERDQICKKWILSSIDTWFWYLVPFKLCEIYTIMAKVYMANPRTPGRLSQLSVWLPLRSWSWGSCVWASERALCWQHGARFRFSVPLFLPLPCLHSRYQK